jgi:hypothetical protein
MSPYFFFNRVLRDEPEDLNRLLLTDTVGSEDSGNDRREFSDGKKPFC